MVMTNPISSVVQFHEASADVELFLLNLGRGGGINDGSTMGCGELPSHPSHWCASMRLAIDGHRPPIVKASSHTKNQNRWSEEARHHFSNDFFIDITAITGAHIFDPSLTKTEERLERLDQKPQTRHRLVCWYRSCSLLSLLSNVIEKFVLCFTCSNVANTNTSLVAHKCRSLLN